MPLNSVQLYVKSVLNGITVPGQPQTLTAAITPPVFEDIGAPRCFIWGGRVQGSRQTMPRGAGFRKLPWLIDIYLVYLTNPQNTTVDSEFPLVIDAVLNKLWTTQMPTIITDPATEVVTQIQAIGEEWTLDYPPERTPGTLKMLWYSALLTTTVLEVPQS